MSFPIMAEAFSGLTQQIQFAVLDSTQENFDTVESAKAISYFQASLQPLHPRKLLVKPEGERRWKWFSVWTSTDLETGTYVKDAQGLIYKVMAKSDWSQAAFHEYEVIQSATLGSGAP